jgi:predicted permease
MLSPLFSRIWSTFRRHRLEEEFNEEVQAHLEMLTERFTAQGMEPEEAFYAARRQFGGVTQMKEELRRRRAFPPVDVLLQDLRHAFRQLRNAKRFTASAAVTLALGIGASTAVFSVLNTVVLRPLPFAGPDRLMAFASIDRRGTPHPTSLSYPTFFDFRQQNRVFEHLVSYRDDRFTLSGSLPAIQVVGEIVSWDLFPLLGVQPELGPGFRREEEKAGTHVAVLSDGLWRSRFGGDPGILSRQIRINGKSFRVAGVAPAGFRFPVDKPEVQLWTTLSEDATVTEFTPLSRQRGARVLDVIGRLRPGVTVKQAQEQMDQIAASLANEYPNDNKNIATTLVMPELERLTGRSRKPLIILLGAVTLLLLIACANVASLLLARSTERRREFTLRTAIGASRLALARQVLIESLALGMVGSASGVLLAVGILEMLLPLAGDSIPRIAQVSIDARVVGFSVIVTILTSLVFGAAPIIQAVRTTPANALKQDTANIARGQHRFRSALIIGQVALGLVLIVGAELLISSFVSLVQRDPGFRADHLLTFDIGLPDTRSVSTQISFCDRLLERLRAIPGVQAAATGSPLPLQGDQMSVSFDIEERRASAPDRPHSDMAIVTPGYFAAMGIPLRKGRDFSERDDSNAPRVLVVNEAFARKYFPGEDVIGKRIEPGATNGKEGTKSREIIGVVGNAKQVALNADPDPIYYFPYKQLSWGMGSVVLRTSVPPLKVERAARDVVTSLDREAPMYRVRTGTEISEKAIAPARFPMVLMSSFAAAALLLTVSGLYGVLSYAVARRRREIGVRIAVGAERSQIVGLVLRQAGLLVTAGMTLGLAGAIGVGRLLESMVYGVRPGVLLLVAGGCCVMAVTGVVAAYLPAARAASVDPMQALRSD